jgi:hypothetical protein
MGLQIDEKTILRWSLEDSTMPVLRRGRVVRAFPERACSCGYGARSGESRKNHARAWRPRRNSAPPQQPAPDLIRRPQGEPRALTYEAVPSADRCQLKRAVTPAAPSFPTAHRLGRGFNHPTRHAKPTAARRHSSARPAAAARPRCGGARPRPPRRRQPTQPPYPRCWGEDTDNPKINKSGICGQPGDRRSSLSDGESIDSPRTLFQLTSYPPSTPSSDAEGRPLSQGGRR